MSVKRITAKELREMGLLWAINRDLLHPLGLALEITQHEDGTETFGGVWDFRDDPGGIIFVDDLHRSGFEKFSQYMNDEGIERLRVREEQLGYVEQPYPDDPEESEERDGE